MRVRMLAAHLLVFALPLTLFAQVKAVAVGCDSGHHWRASCNGEADCDAKLARHNCEAHGQCSSSSGSTASPVLSMRDTPTRVVMKSAIFGGFAGALAGSFKLNADSGAMAGAGAAVGAGAMMVYAAGKNRGDWSRTSTVAVAALGGAAVGAGVGLMADGKYEKGSPEDLAHKDQAGSMAAVGAGAGALVGFGLSTLATSQFAAAPRFRWIAQRVRVIDSGRRIGFTVLW